MPTQEVLILAVTKMLGGVCIAGMTADRDPITWLRWVRPIREYSHVLLGDITTAEKRVLRPFDVVELKLLRPHPVPPHTEDWITDFVRHRPCIVRRLEGERRAGFLGKHLDTAPRQVLDSQHRSLCLIQPSSVTGCFRLDPHSGAYDARLAFRLDGRTYRGSYAKGGLSVTDMKWRALGRDWLPDEGGWTEFDEGDLEARCGIREIYLAVGLSRPFQGNCWPMIVGVHTLPDYQATVDYDNL
jgi:hypothetical protein